MEVKRVLLHGVVVEVVPGVEGLVDQANLDVTHMTPHSLLPGDRMDVKVLEVRPLLSHISPSMHWEVQQGPCKINADQAPLTS